MTYEKALEFFSQQMREADAAGVALSTVSAEKLDDGKVLVCGMTHDGSVAVATVIDGCPDRLSLPKIEAEFFVRAIKDVVLGEKTPA